MLLLRKLQRIGGGGGPSVGPGPPPNGEQVQGDAAPGTRHERLKTFDYSKKSKIAANSGTNSRVRLSVAGVW